MPLKSFKYAFKGIAKEMLSGSSFRVMLVFLVLVLAGGFIFRITALEWAIVLFCSGGVLGAEMINTAIESIVDMITTDHHPVAEKIKDLAAGAVLMFSIFSAIIGCIIFIPRILGLF